MHVRGETSAKCKCVRTGLFLSDTPMFWAIRLGVQISANQFRPLDARFRFDQTMLLIERDYVIERTRIDAHAVCGELLAAHRMPTSRNGDGQAFSRRRTHDLCEFVPGTRRQKLANTGAIEL